MPRIYKRKVGRRYASYTADNMTAALKELAEGKSQRAVSKKYNIARGTLQNKIAGKHGKIVGHPKVLSDVEEVTLVNHLLIMSDWGFPLDRYDLRVLVKSYLDKAGRIIKQFTNNYPGDDWSQNFMRRHRAQISQRMCQNIAPNRASVNPQEVKDYFVNLENTIKDVAPENIVNYDETNLTDDPGRQKSIFRRGTKYPERSMHHSKSATSLMFAGSAAGELLPIYVVYRAENMWDTWTLGGPPGTRYNRSKSGWFDNVCFDYWFLTIMLPYFRKKEGKKVLIGDNLSSHFNDSVIQACQEHNISFVCLPPNSTHMCQPLDVAFFRPLKQKWRTILTDWKTGGGRRSPTVTKDKFPSLLKDLLTAIEENRAQNLKAGFRKSGIVPLDADTVLSRLPSSEPNSQETRNVQLTVSQVLLDHLKEMRYGNEDEQQKVRRKKVSVEPGKSVTNLTEVVQPTGAQRTRKTTELTDSESSTSSSDDDIDEKNESSDSDMDHSLSELAAQPADDDIEGDVENVKQGDFLLVKYQLHKSSKYYVGEVIKPVKDGYSMKFMRRQKGSERRFIFPTVEDEDHIAQSQVEMKLKHPEIRRGIHDFGISFTGFNVS